MTDLNRPVLCLLGLPIDRVTMDQALILVREAVQSRKQLFLSTPNLNFLIGSQSNPAFRQSVLDSDLSLADGMPLVHLSRWLGVPLPERVTGSGLFERLRHDPVPAGHAPLKVFFFGGPPGAAAAACANLQQGSSGLLGVGYQTPGFGSVEDMSQPEYIDQINASGADFLVVALGGVKGQAWIQHNLKQLKIPVISHLGAVVNFAAGTVHRAPRWVQSMGLEWLWRIKEEPSLWRRYWYDGLAFCRLFVVRLLPYGVYLFIQRHTSRSERVKPSVTSDGLGCKIRLEGVIGDPVPCDVRLALLQVQAASGPLELDLSRLRHFGPSFAALLLLLDQSLATQQRGLQFQGLTPQLKRLFRWNGLDALLRLSN
ncbi:MAG: WecB/TagA/CpsF family glycosyltransferase [Burkholderiaceae bacterium]